jgi:hypothetical protein
MKIPSRTALALAIAAIPMLASGPAQARITSVTWSESRSQAPSVFPGNSYAFGDLSFGAVGQYEKLRGTAMGELDPDDPRNEVITDIELVPRNANGMVAYSMDVFVLRPADPTKGNQRLLFDFNNRGQMRLGRLNNGTVTSDPITAEDAGDGFVMRHGFSVAGNGWDFGATGIANMKITVPQLADLPGPSYEYLVFDNATTQTANLTFPANTLDKALLARLTVRAHLADTLRVMLDSEWEYTSTAGTAIRLLPAGTRFQQSAIYEFSYTAKNPVVSGVGLAATRDWVSFLRHATAAEGNPLAGHVVHTYSYSISQPSRTLNDFVLFGFNEDLQGRRVLDGILSHTGGGSGDQINYRYGQTGRTERNRQNHLYPEGVFPFAHQTLTDHLSGKTAGRDDRCRASNTCPKRFEVNTSNEYWVKAGSLLHSDTHGKDLEEPDDVRYYLMSGQSHGVGDVTDRGVCREFTNGVSPYPAHRALLLALDRWVSDGVRPPKSEIPHGGHRAWAVSRPGSQVGVVPQAELGWPRIPGVLYTGVITTRYFLDFGDQVDDGIISNYPPSVVGRPSYPIFVSKVDEDGNEIAGVRMPGVAAPTATTTGWALRRDEFGGPDGCESEGQNIPFARTKAERLASGDPRKSLEERYKDHDGYVEAVAKAARQLQKDGFLVEEDVQRFIAEAEASDVLR